MNMHASYFRLSLVASALTLFSWLVAGGSESKEPNVIYFPVLAECKEETLAFFRSSDWRRYVDAQYIAFDVPLQSHPTLVGFISLSSRTRDRERLKELANNPLFKCFPNTSFAGEFPTKGGFDSIDSTLQIAVSAHGAKRIYLFLDGEKGKYQMYFNQPEK